MGADFNIFEYVDPELESLPSGEKNDILSDLVNDTSADQSKAKYDDL